MYFEKLAEERIRQAQVEGAFDNLSGKGKPLRLEDDSLVPRDLRVAYKILKDAHYLPPEVELHKEILSLKDLLGTIEDEGDRLRKVREINLLITKLNLLRKKPLPLEVLQVYATKLAKPNKLDTLDALNDAKS
jgi:hypothetical protein